MTLLREGQYWVACHQGQVYARSAFVIPFSDGTACDLSYLNGSIVICEIQKKVRYCTSEKADLNYSFIRQLTLCFNLCSDVRNRTKEFSFIVLDWNISVKGRLFSSRRTEKL